MFIAIFFWIGGSEVILCVIVGFVLHYPSFFRNLLLI